MVARVVTVVALKSFDDFVEGQKYLMTLTERVAQLIALEYFRLV